MEIGDPSSVKPKSSVQIVIDIFGVIIAISTLTLPLFFILNLSQNQLDQSLQVSKVSKMATIKT